ncbi:hypothetical protein Ctob_008483 [Chrysochromulina tobinii]|uniref:EF-hand domain-containing protein n=1 Tax=Chrysochromulina tobinii TaxID=1460289 RepID=A0A0M0JTQ0_9EUKA|nr:hypothetical protein Ctob_008483 [Chrysochromulina tobinii]|eukprot:KOO29722.1 hypothetical protein Ctob_008483 [Chrysochromulina sp. CCMP291]
MTPPISELDVDSLFALLDVDGSGSIEYSELHARLRQGLNVTLEKKLQVGAAVSPKFISDSTDSTLTGRAK